MNLIKILALLLSLAYMVSAFELNVTSRAIDFEAYKDSFKKTYNSPMEHQKRKAIFESNVRKIDEYNKWAEENGHESRMGITDFTDLDYSEFIRSYTGFVPSLSLSNDIVNVSFLNTAKNVAASVPVTLDWRAQGKVNAIKNQGQCGSCWTFSITTITETSYAIKYNSLPILAEQELLDCVTKGSYGCNGGDPMSAANFAVSSGIMQSYYYPYVGYKNSQCKLNPSNGGVAKPVKAYRWSGSEADLKQVVSQYGSVAIAMYVSPTFQNFKSSGLFIDQACNKVSSSQINHAMAIVGYGTTQSGVDYWLVRNSWGTNWGDAGYFKLPRGYNYCGVMTQPIYISF